MRLACAGAERYVATSALLGDFSHIDGSHLVGGTCFWGRDTFQSLWSSTSGVSKGFYTLGIAVQHLLKDFFAGCVLSL